MKPRLKLKKGDGAWTRLDVKHWDREGREIIARDPSKRNGHRRCFLIEEETLVEGPVRREEPCATVWRKRPGTESGT